MTSIQEDLLQIQRNIKIFILLIYRRHHLNAQVFREE